MQALRLVIFDAVDACASVTWASSGRLGCSGRESGPVGTGPAWRYLCPYLEIVIYIYIVNYLYLHLSMSISIPIYIYIDR